MEGTSRQNFIFVGWGSQPHQHSCTGLRAVTPPTATRHRVPARGGAKSDPADHYQETRSSTEVEFLLQRVCHDPNCLQVSNPIAQTSLPKVLWGRKMAETTISVMCYLMATGWAGEAIYLPRVSQNGSSCEDVSAAAHGEAQGKAGPWPCAAAEPVSFTPVLIKGLIHQSSAFRSSPEFATLQIQDFASVRGVCP